ncbi:glycosyltransferase involved in cell wall biosynthesis [Catenulispora sp. GAS73]|uniref:glycosyltransferase family 4 protein n=1 Tax=Catenulispora sp. GAS73 TaxID=3156269 RepID=UPI0035158CB4
MSTHALRILLVRPESTGGIGVHVDSLTRALREVGHDVRTLVATGTGAIPAIRHAARQAQADVVHAHGLRAGAAACLATRKRTVVTLHNAPSTRAGELLLRLIAQRADAVLAASHDLVATATRDGAKNASFGPVVAPALPAPTLPTPEVRDALRRELGLAADDDRRLVLAVGRLAPQKDYDTLLKALITIRERLGAGHVPPVAIAGEGRQRSVLQAAIDAHDLPVALLGHRADIADLLRAADVFVMCSTWEARPLALQEALRAGVPRVIATDVGGVAEVTAGYLPLIPPGDPEALSRALLDTSAAPAPPKPDWDALWPSPEEELSAVLAAYASNRS